MVEFVNRVFNTGEKNPGSRPGTRNRTYYIGAVTPDLAEKLTDGI